WQVGEKLQESAPVQLLPQDCPAGAVDPVQLKRVLGKVDADRRYRRHGGWSPRSPWSTPADQRASLPSAGRVHPSNHLRDGTTSGSGVVTAMRGAPVRPAPSSANRRFVMWRGVGAPMPSTRASLGIP